MAFQVDEEKDENFGYAFQLVMSITLPMALQAAVELGIFEIIANAGLDSKLSTSEIAEKIPTRNPDAPMMLDCILGLLASYQVLGCSLNGLERQYSLNCVSKYFVPNQNGVSLGPYLTLYQDKVIQESWLSKLKDVVLEGGCPFKKVHGAYVYEYCGIDPRFNQITNVAMLQRTNIVIEKILEKYKGFENLKQLVDVGGGLGHTLKAITSKYPYIKGINFDLPHVVKHALAYPGVENIAGNMLEGVPKGDAILLKSIIRCWSDEHCLRLLKKCYEAVPDDGKVIIIDPVLPVMPNTSVAAKINFQSNLITLALCEGGKERTENEFLALAIGAGFGGIRCECRACNFWVMELFK